METFWFWMTAAGMALAVAAVLIRSLVQARAETTPAALADMQVYRDQLSEADRDLARGTITDTEAQRLKTEIARRLLDADRSLQTQKRATAGTQALWLPAGLALAAIAAAFLIYNRIGVPWYPDLPIQTRIAMADDAMANRPSQAEAAASAPTPPPPEVDADFTALMEKLRAAVDPATTTDLRGLELLARNEAALGNYTAAETAQRRIIAVKGDQATGEDHAGLAEVLIRAAGGYISPEAETALIRALELDPKNGSARYFAGLMFAQGGRYDRAFDLWRPLMEDSPPDAPWYASLREQIGEVAMRAGVDYTPPDTAGPSAADMDAASEMTPEDRQAMIEGMVGQLTERLATEGGTAEEWAKLINALGVLGRTDEAQKIYTEAKTTFAARPDDLATVTAAATAAGLAP